ncbi:carbonic anhydrase [Mastigocladopsis repens]|uniref:carbonic anhydrase n=1 Tax=Mastigocladopsis repens TaxID=221287 RepID=UPI00030942BF|nr:carbonic anhydrase [Mastigocladopsis repens]
MERRDFLKLGVTGAFGLVVTASDLLSPVEQVQAAELPPGSPQSLSPDAALQKLMEGNQRFIQHQSQHPDQSQGRLQEVAQAQHPFATILSCADSRVPAEIIFDYGIGDIFDVRIAGNIATPEAIGSIEYAVALLDTPLLMVLGHERCGAVTAAVQNKALLGEIGSFVKAIKPAVEQVKDQSGDAVENAVVANVYYQIERLKRSPLLTERLQSDKLKIVGGRYDLDTGRVTIIT